MIMIFNLYQTLKIENIIVSDSDLFINYIHNDSGCREGKGRREGRGKLLKEKMLLSALK